MSKSSRLFVAAAALCLLAASCNGFFLPADQKIEGYWKSSYGDGFEIGDGKFTQYDNASKAVSFAGTIVNRPDVGAKEGFLIVKITDAGTWGKPVGNYIIIRWKNFIGAAIEQSSPYKAGGKNDGLPSAAEAEAEYTVANGYFGFYGEYLRQ